MKKKTPITTKKIGRVALIFGDNLSQETVVKEAGKILDVITTEKAGKGHILQHEQMYHYNIKSVDPRIWISSKEPLEPSDTRPLASKFLNELRITN